MILTGGTDTVVSPECNLRVAQNRTAAVLRGLVARGIPAERFQLLAKGETDLAVPTASVPQIRQWVGLIVCDREPNCCWRSN